MALAPLYKKQPFCSVAKYLAALLVVNGHLFLFCGGDADVARLMNLGACCVGLFFFFSAYGLTYSFKAKGNDYLHNFFHKRFVRLLIPLFTAYAVALPIYAIFRGPIDWTCVFSTLLWGGPYLKYSWFVPEIALVYILFYASMRTHAQYMVKIWILTGLILLLMAVLVITHQPLWYIVSLPGFIIGIWYEEYETKIQKHILNGKIVPLLLATTAVWFSFWQWSSLGGLFIPAYRYFIIASFLSVIFFVALSVVLLSCLKSMNYSGGG